MDTEFYNQVFQACEPDEYGFISLKNLANISRSHVESNDVDRILQIFDNANKDRVNLEEFCEHISSFLDQNKDKENMKQMDNLIVNPDVPVNAMPKHLSDGQRQLGANLSYKRKNRKNSRTRVSQTRLTGAIPLVNTSSEDEQDLDEDSFDRKIAEDLEFAGKQFETSTRLLSRASPPRFLVRGSNVRSTLRTKSQGRLPFVPLVVTESPQQNMLSPISVVRNGATTPDNFDESVAAPAASTNGFSRHSSPINKSFHSVRSEPDQNDDLVETANIVKDLEIQLKSLEAANNDAINQKDEFLTDNHVEESMDEIIARIRKEASQSIAHAKEMHREEISAMSRERELEISNYKLRLDQLQGELDRQTKEKTDLTEKVRLLFLEKEQAEDTALNLQEQIIKLQNDLNRENNLANNTAVNNDTEDNKNCVKTNNNCEENENKHFQDKIRNERDSRSCSRERMSEVSKMSLGSDQMSTTESYESEYLLKIQQMAARIQEQDDFVTELKEDNLVLRNQKRSLVDFYNNSKNKRNFLGVSKNRSFNDISSINSTLGLDIDDPQDIRMRTRSLHTQLVEQTDMYNKVKAYLDEVLMTIMMKNPDILEKTHSI